MNAAAVIIAADLNKCDGIPAAMYKIGAVSSAQHMVASFNKAGIQPVILILDEDCKKLEKQLAPSGALFLRSEGSIGEYMDTVLSFLPEKYERLFICNADRPFILPQTIEAMLKEAGDVIIPRCKGKAGPVYLLSRRAADELRLKPGRSLSKAISALSFEAGYIETGDSGIHRGLRKAAADEAALETHQNALTRPLLDISVTGETLLLEPRLIKLLRLVDALRSVRAACEISGMSYSIAWNMLNSTEERLGYPLITRNQGGRSGSGSELTDDGRRILEAYTGFENAMNEKVQALYEECFEGII